MTIVYYLLFFGTAQATFYVQEGKGGDRFIGNVLHSDSFPKVISKEDITGLHCSFLSRGNPLSKYFSIDENTGSITLLDFLDRESVCEEATAECLISLDVAVSTQSVPIQIFRIHIEIVDVNDNAPSFSHSQLNLSIPEDTMINTEFVIPTAIDSDVGLNAVVTYHIDPNSDVFGVITKNSLDGVSGAALILQRELDRETISLYEIRVLAKDSGFPQQTGTLIVTIHVKDANDHSPIINQSVINVNLPENIQIGKLITTILATDEDSNENSLLRYRFHPRTLSVSRGIFDMNSTSGEIRLLSNLDYEMKTHYKLIVEAFDNGIPSLSSQALVNISISDINDNAPVVNVNYISGQPYAVLSEDISIGSFVAYVSVNDADTGVNSQVTCRLDHPDFKLRELEENEFQIIVGAPLDRERKAEYYFHLTCQDGGVPTIGGSASISVKLQDENDNAPTFLQDEYPILIDESLAVGSRIIVLSSTDEDEGMNANITYAFVSSEPETEWFRIDSQTGGIYVARPLDRETFPRTIITVTATDGGKPPRRSRATVNISLLDANDEYPAFGKLDNFTISENLPKLTLVGKVHAVDKDLGNNGKVQYRLLKNNGSMFFQIDSDSGEIRSSRVLDREKTPQITLTVMAMDLGQPTLSSTVSVKVIVKDINDNHPVFIFPSYYGNNTAFFSNTESGQSVTQIFAVDPDNSFSLVYSIDTFTDIFSLNSTSGEIYLAKKLKNEWENSPFYLNVSVNDKGTPSLMTSSMLKLMYRESDISTQADFNKYIVVIVIAITVVIALVIFGIIYIIRKHDAAMKEQGGKGDNSKRVSVTPSQQPINFNDPLDDEQIEVTLNNQRSHFKNLYRTSQKGTSNVDNIRNGKFPINSQQTWLTDYSCNNEVLGKSGPRGSVSDLSEKTFDSGKGGSEVIRGDNSSIQGHYKQEREISCSGRNNRVASLKPSREVFTKNNGSWEVQQRYSPGLLTDNSSKVNQSGSEESASIWTCPHPSENSLNGNFYPRPDDKGDWFHDYNITGSPSHPEIHPRGRYDSEEDCSSYPSFPEYSDGHNAYSVFV